MTQLALTTPAAVADLADASRLLEQARDAVARHLDEHPSLRFWHWSITESATCISFIHNTIKESTCEYRTPQTRKPRTRASSRPGFERRPLPHPWHRVHRPQAEGAKAP